MGIGKGYCVWIIFQWNYIDLYILTTFKIVWEVSKVIMVEKFEGLCRQSSLGFWGTERT